jgi:hypothetical protein
LNELLCNQISAYFEASNSFLTKTKLMQHHPTIRNNAVIVSKPRSRRTAVVLALLLGPLGLFYTDPFGGFVMFVTGLVALITFPVPGMIFTWFACIVWALVSVCKANAMASKQGSYFTGRY